MIKEDDIVQIDAGRASCRQFNSDPGHHIKKQQILLFFYIHIFEPLCYTLSTVMRNDKEKVLKLRLAGKSYSEINRLLGVPKSTLSGWLKNLQLSNTARQRLDDRTREGSLKGLLKRNKLQTQLAHKKAGDIRKSTSSEIKKISRQELLILGVALYWGEGYKRPIIKDGIARSYHPVSLSNSDPKLVEAFLRFLREICEVNEDKIRANLRIFQHQNSDQLLQFWSKLTRIPKERFEKFYYGVSKSSQGKRPFNILPYGTIQIRVNDTALFHKIMGWLEGVSKLI